jgi:hypothetical protein
MWLSDARGLSDFLVRFLSDFVPLPRCLPSEKRGKPKDFVVWKRHPALSALKQRLIRNCYLSSPSGGPFPLARWTVPRLGHSALRSGDRGPRRPTAGRSTPRSAPRWKSGRQGGRTVKARRGRSSAGAHRREPRRPAMPKPTCLSPGTSLTCPTVGSTAPRRTRSPTSWRPPG